MIPPKNEKPVIKALVKANQLLVKEKIEKERKALELKEKAEKALIDLENKRKVQEFKKLADSEKKVAVSQLPKKKPAEPVKKDMGKMPIPQNHLTQLKQQPLAKPKPFEFAKPLPVKPTISSFTTPAASETGILPPQVKQPVAKQLVKTAAPIFKNPILEGKDNFEIDSDSDEDEDGKRIPDWAYPDQLVEALKKQEKIDPWTIFGDIGHCNLDAIFGKSRQGKHRESGTWTVDALTAYEEQRYKKSMGYI